MAGERAHWTKEGEVLDRDQEALLLTSRFFLHPKTRGDGCEKSVAFLALVAIKNGKSACVRPWSVALVMKESNEQIESLAK